MSSTLEGKRTRTSASFRKKWDRVLPLDEMLLDRWLKAKQLGFGEGSSVYEHVLVYGKPKVGKNVWIGPFTLIDATGGLEIGDGCDISVGVKILTHSTHLRCVSERKQDTVRKAVKIGKFTFIGTNAVILPGVKVGDHCIIGAGAVVTKDVPPRSVATGVPAKIVGKVVLGKKISYK
ncbi:2,3,4,5-tetrahydropyridine-2,6-dicarboxylate N-acetyltransferase [Candidatus Norongarragalina meridionalis]|nr:2,3,4,5-tetrahydropyridine-2,6-dicarboxylate N-acetyltransferase [Candidatus Norongarragalina meridionalis]